MATIEGISCCSDSFECLLEVLICNNILNCLCLLVCLHGFYKKGCLKGLNIYFMQCVAINVSTKIMYNWPRAEKS